MSVVFPAAAQAVHGAIVGTVTDGNGAVVPGASVTLTDTDKGVVRTTTSSGVGDYQFLDADADHYMVVVEAKGFEKWSTTGLQLATLQTLRVDAKLVVGSAQVTVNVAGENTGAIQTETPAITTTFNYNDVIDLPTNFRASAAGTSVLGAMSAMPGVQADQGAYSVEGNLPFTSDMTVDGITNIQVGSSGNPVLFPSADDVASIQLTGVLAPAEFGDPAQVSVTSKAGANTLHGSGWIYHQNSGMNANTFGSTIRPHVVANTFGGKLGGPVVIPHLYDGHNKSFFFVDYEGFRLPQDVTMSAVVPTAAMKRGDFSGYSNPSATYTGLTDPNTGQSWGNTIPANALSPIAQKFLQFYPDPNTAATLTGGGTVPTSAYVNGESANYYANVPEPTHSNQVDVRGDKYFGTNQKVLLWGRYSYYNFPSTSAYNLTFDPSTNVYDSSNLVTSLSWTIKPDLINVFTFGFTRWTNGDANPFNGMAFTQGLGLTALNDLWYNGFPYLSFTNISSPPSGRLNDSDIDNTYSYNESLSWTKGTHAMKFGGDVRSYTYIGATGITNGDNYGNFYFSNAGNAVGTFTGVDFADFLTGVPNNTTYDTAEGDIDGTTAEYHVYAEDHWRVTPRLSVDYGVRYEYRPAFYDKNGFYANMDYSVPQSARVIYPTFPQPNLLSVSTLQSSNACDADGIHTTNDSVVNGAPCMPVVSNTEAGLPRGLRYVDKDRILPRVGLAYRLTDDGKWVVRSGFGLYNVTVMGQTFHSLTGTVQGNSSAYTNAVNPDTGQPLFEWPAIGYGSGTSGCTNCYGTNEFNASIDIHYHDAETAQWALTVEHDLGRGYGIRATYNGSQTSHLNLKQDENTLPLSKSVSAYNQPLSARRFPNWGVLMNYGSQATASYHALEIEAQHQMAQGLQFNSTFTYARALSNNTGASDTQYSGERGGGDFASWVFDKSLDYGNTPGPRRLHWLTTSIYQLPVGRGRQFGANMPHAVDALVGGWQLSNIFIWQTGAYLTPTFAGGQTDPSGTGSGLATTVAGWVPTDASQHPDRVTSTNWKPEHQGRSGWINPLAFACPGWSAWKPGEACNTGAGFNPNGTPVSTYGPALPIGRFGNSGIGTVQGPGYIQLNSGLAKVFTVDERFKLRVEASFTNVTNHTNLNENNLNLNLSSASFGVVTAGLGGRAGQIAARLDF
ncbi:TonB-dependent receptor [Silvibacterium acidisoli]|uniref:TonB-dependent receptor n=1 Tax=Acidobacteriaceae bacterium ZG23-2 TaxID=2883246 RepID=UPI00406CD908